jgi:hypothetical protein
MNEKFFPLQNHKDESSSLKIVMASLPVFFNARGGTLAFDRGNYPASEFVPISKIAAMLPELETGHPNTRTPLAAIGVFEIDLDYHRSSPGPLAGPYFLSHLAMSRL